ncbi:hypothetical protein QCA50_013638 [Cerrena zonata]|uniref:Uncharacterized protein n=1 Tax=Cerrena zonata TaxID=2478898 RepID=A0AAW0FRH6_9APHY
MSHTLVPNNALPNLRRDSLRFFERGDGIHSCPPELKSRIAHVCDMPTLISLRYDSEWEHFVELELELSLIALLAKFTPDPAAFRKMMKDTNTIISGSTALYFLLRQPSSWTPGDVDLIVSPTYFGTVVRFLTQLPEGRIESPNRAYDSYPNNNNVGFSKVLKVTTAHGRFDVIKSLEDSPFHPLAFYWGTHVMNAVTSDSFLCAYPSLTFHNKGAILSNPLKKSAAAAVLKYEKRGFTFTAYGSHTREPTNACTDTVLCARRDRYFGDKETVVVHFSSLTPAGLEGPTLSTAWRLGGLACQNDQCFLPADHKVCTVLLEGRSGKDISVLDSDTEK